MCAFGVDLAPTVHVYLRPVVDDDPEGATAAGRRRRRKGAVRHYSNSAGDDPGAAPRRATPNWEDQTRRTPRPLRRPTVAGSLDADEDDAAHFASAAIYLPAARGDAARRARVRRWRARGRRHAVFLNNNTQHGATIQW